MANLFKQLDLKNKTSRSGFDLSKRVLFTASAGELLPIWHKRTMPGDFIEIDLNAFTRTQPVNTAAFTRMTEYYDFFYIPYRLLWKNAPQSFTKMPDNPSYATSSSTAAIVAEEVPYCSMIDIKQWVDNFYEMEQQPYSRQYTTNLFGYSRRLLANKLFNYLGYGFRSEADTSDQGEHYDDWFYDFDKVVPIFPLLAYHKIYYDFYRNQQWESNRPELYNVDYLDGDDMLFSLPSWGTDTNVDEYWKYENICDIHYANFGKDLYFGLLPNSQYGDESFAPVQVDVSGTIPAVSSTAIIPSANIWDGSNSVYTSKKLGIEDDPNAVGLTGSGSGELVSDAPLKTRQITTSVLIPAKSFRINQLTTGLSILRLRMAQATQRWKEISQSGNQDYRTQLEKHFGVSLPPIMSGLCQFLGGLKNPIVINEVVNNNLADDGSGADIKGKGISQGIEGKKIKFKADEAGIVMCIYHVEPQIDYALSGLSRELQDVDVDSYAIPEYDKIGYESVTLDEFFGDYNLSGTGISPDTAIGYAPRYYSYKTDLDEIKGDFRETMPHWVAPFDSELLSKLFSQGVRTPNYVWRSFKICPNILDDIFVYGNQSASNGSVTTDTFLCCLNMDVKAARNLDFDGLPY